MIFFEVVAEPFNSRDGGLFRHVGILVMVVFLVLHLLDINKITKQC